MTKNNTDPAGLSSSPHYIIVADDIDPHGAWDNVEDGDRIVVSEEDGVFVPVRIERPVPTSERRAALRQLARDGQSLAEQQVQYDDGEWSREVEVSPVPTREQIAESLRESDPEGAAEVVDFYYPMADAVLTLIQNGADRG